MDDPATTSRRGWSDAILLALLLLIAGAIHGWILTHTEVPARDSIGFIRYSLALQSQPLTEALQHGQQHPAYPLAIAAVSLPVRHFLGMTSESLMLSAQLTSALAGMLLVLPMFYLGKELFDRRVGFWAALLFQVLPAASRVTSDGLSDALFFLLTATALLLGARALRRQSPTELGLCGLFSALAYLTRPEGALIALVVLLILLAVQVRRNLRWPWRRAAAGCTAFAVAFAIAAGPYMTVIGGFSNKPTSRKFLNLSHETDTLPPPPDQARAAFGPLLAVWWNGYAQQSGHPPLSWALWALIREMVRVSQSVLWLPLLLGLWQFRRRLVQVPGLMVLLVLAGIYAVIVARMAVVVGYLSERHTLFLMFCGMFWAAAELVWLSERIPVLLAKVGRPVPLRCQSLVTIACLSALAAGLATEALRPLHANRAGHRAAGLWLRDRFRPGDEILDPFCWAHYYAGAVFAENVGLAPAHPRTRYIVLENSTGQHSRLPLMVIARHLAMQGVPVYRWIPGPELRKQRAVEVIVYAIQPPGTQH